MSAKLSDQFNLAGKTALVTGGGSGIGKEITRILAEAGATVMIAARGEERLRQAAEEISADTGATIHVQQADLADKSAPEKLITDAQAAMGGLDILIGNAVVNPVAKTYEFTDEQFDHIMDVNLRANCNMTRAAVPAMKEKGWGRIVYISSLAAGRALRNTHLCLYASSKAALEGYARFAAAELATDGITVNCLVSGAVRTQRVDDTFEELGFSAEQMEGIIQYQSSLIAMNRFGRPEEIAGTVLLLASDAGSYITGSRYVVDGGWEILGDTHIP